MGGWVDSVEDGGTDGALSGERMLTITYRATRYRNDLHSIVAPSTYSASALHRTV